MNFPSPKSIPHFCLNPLVWAALFTLASQMTGTAQTLTLQNPGFETEPAQGWDTEGTVALSDVDFTEGAHALRLKHDAATSSGVAQKVRVSAGKWVLRADLKVVQARGEGARLAVVGADGKVIAAKGGFTDTDGWKEITLPFEVEQTGEVRLEIAFRNSSGEALADNVRILAPESATSRPVATAKADNIARGKRVRLIPQPNYPYCTDEEDELQLTDGKRTRGNYWTQKSTVGWQRSSPLIIIDLEKPEPIGAVTLHSIGGGVAGVRFPKEVKVYVSDDGNHFHFVGETDALHLPQDGLTRVPHAFRLEGLKTRGRYVMIQVTADGVCFFTDEVEIERGDFDPANVAFTGKPLQLEDISYASMGLTPEAFRRGHFPESPHIPWTIPRSGRPLKAIFLNSSMRQVVEVAQRMDIDYVPVEHRPRLTGERLPQFSQDQILEALPTCDVMVVGQMSWGAFPEPLLDAILRRVREGMGLILLPVPGNWPQPPAALLKEKPVPGDDGVLDLLPMELIPGYHKPKRSHFTLARYGKGRVALLNSGVFTRPSSTLLPTFRLEDYQDDTNGPLEFYFAAVNRLILWAAGQPRHGLAALEATPEKLVVTLDSPAPGRKVRVEVRDPLFRVIHTATSEVPQAGQPLEFAMPGGIAGVHPVNVWLLDAEEKVVDFAATYYRQATSASLGKIAVAKPLFEAGEAIAATVSLSGTTEGATLRAAVFDTEGRQVSEEKTFAVKDGKGELSLAYPHPQTLAARLVCRLYQGETLLDERVERVWVKRPEAHDFAFIGWYAPHEQPGGLFIAKRLRELKVDAQVSINNNVEKTLNAAYANIRFAPENVARIAPVPANESLVREPCLTDPAYRAMVEKRLTAMAREGARYGTLDWSIGDEEALARKDGKADYCFSPSCLEGFRNALQTRYPSLAALNESWGSAFRTWEEVKPMTLDEVPTANGSLAPWLEHRRYMESVFADFHAWTREIIRREIPEARVGLSGSQNPTSWNGYDWWKLMHAIDHLSGYGGVQMALQRSFLQPGTFYTTFLGYDYSDSDEQSARSRLWELLFNGANGVNYYTMVSHSLNCPLLLNDGSLTRKAHWFFEELAEIKSGLGRLFIEGKPGRDGVAIHYSPASLHVATARGLADPRQKRRAFGMNLTNLSKALADSHAHFEFLHEEQLCAGKLSEYKILFLPWSAAISEGEAEAIRQFVREGGTLVADSFCGLYDGHGNPKEMLADVLGLHQNLTPPKLEDASLELTDSPFAGAPRRLTVTSGASGIRLAGARAYGMLNGMPALMVNPFGKGKAIFLNASFSNYSEEISGGIGGEVQVGRMNSFAVVGPIRELLSALIREAGAAPPVTLTNAGADPAEITCRRTELGEATLLGVSRRLKGRAIDRQDRLAFTLRLAAPRYLYESRSGKSYGKVEEISDTLVRGLPKVYAALPYEVASVRADAPEEARPGEAVEINVTVNAGGAARVGTHVVNLSVRGPDGRERALYGHNLLAREGQGKAVIPFAFNDPAGEWTITLRDAASGVRTTRHITLRPGK